MTKKRARHTIVSLVSATGKAKRTIREALDRGWFGPVLVEIVNDVTYYIMAEDAIEFYKKKGYEKKVIVEKKDDSNFFAYKYTLDEARSTAEIRADRYMEDVQRVRLEMLGNKGKTVEDIRQTVYDKFVIEESAKTVRVTQGKLSVDEQRQILELPLNFPTLILDKMTPNQSVYMLEKVHEYITTLGSEKWKEPWIRNIVINLIQEEIYQHYLHDLRRFKPGTIQDKIDDALTKSETRWIKLADSLGLSLKRSGGYGEGEDEHQRDDYETANAADNL